MCWVGGRLKWKSVQENFGWQLIPKTMLFSVWAKAEVAVAWVRGSKADPSGFSSSPNPPFLCYEQKGWGNTVETIYSSVTYTTYRIQTEFRDKSRVIRWVFHSLFPPSLSFPQYIYCFWVWFWQGVLIKWTNLLFKFKTYLKEFTG